MAWQKWVLALLGLIVVAVPFLGLSAAAFTWTLAVVGLAVIGLSLWTLNESASADYRRGAGETRFQTR